MGGYEAGGKNRVVKRLSLRDWGLQFCFIVYFKIRWDLRISHMALDSWDLQPKLSGTVTFGNHMALPNDLGMRGSINTRAYIVKEWTQVRNLLPLFNRYFWQIAVCWVLRIKQWTVLSKHLSFHGRFGQGSRQLERLCGTCSITSNPLWSHGL